MRCHHTTLAQILKMAPRLELRGRKISVMASGTAGTGEQSAGSSSLSSNTYFRLLQK